jgi:hypothetical protein
MCTDTVALVSCIASVISALCAVITLFCMPGQASLTGKPRFQSHQVGYLARYDLEKSHCEAMAHGYTHHIVIEYRCIHVWLLLRS